ncbi:ABC-type transport system ATP-binding protein (probable substrate copper) [Natrialba magadii ATCC 43099]|uniref:ABC transporter n=1 Tax=Natrialba magadii (strain ATCC 43099 / DSM 3394 / CCM 3739 / CIP 104546 / IAM 13178 / JCM 8861 / NBRC 102185 / NCIMB 2190 / MS3) TaxID=547559 RepID=D3SZ44_NATMM|nr:ABC transporter ATP-binding protein [Natrialba magadii]ADD06236.1 ABC-type transport system ATP-binding protein (probable substrate copper) [Natrialba magadii ATCC 43099]ELY31049.1 ABC transporter [Natrialba magadii ATCC 43099]
MTDELSQSTSPRSSVSPAESAPESGPESKPKPESESGSGSGSESRSKSESESGPEPAQTPVLEATGLDHDYGAVSVLEDVSVSLRPGTVTALIGPNGSGKTTLIRALAGLHEPTAGTVTYHGPDTARQIGYLPQQPSFRPDFSVIETLRFYASLVGAANPEATARAHLDRVGLGDAASRPADALSGGMTRLLGIAQATIGDPPVIILDEPGSGLDPGMSMHVFDIAAELAADGMAVLLSSHDLELVERVADDVLLLDDGQIIQRGSTADLKNRLDADSLWDVYRNATGGDTDTVTVQGESA